MKILKSYSIIALAAVTLFNCGGTSAILSTPIENIDQLPLRNTELSEHEKQNWGHLDLVRDTVPGMSVDRAYEEIIKDRKGKTTIVAVIDSGIDIDHEDLKASIWTNKKEVANNGKDDDGNGFVDDMHGWNFLGEAYQEQLEFVRMLALGDKTKPRFAEAQAEYDTDYKKYTGYKTQYDLMIQQMKNADEHLSKHFKQSDYTKSDVSSIKTEDEKLKEAAAVAQYVYSLEFDTLDKAIAEISEALEGINDRLNYNLNLDFNGRTTGDNPDDFTQNIYGNNNVKHVDPTEIHGTHVAGIIAATRNNGKGANGVANNVQIMSIRAVSNGDEYDKDIALAIRYAADNGAQIINTSFGKHYSPHPAEVRAAIIYAASKDVLIVNAAGNEKLDLDTKDVYPNDAIGVGSEISDNFISVGSLEPVYGSKMVSSFSNYGKVNVDVFAPGGKIYSTFPDNEYKAISGTSMASPGVAGVAALIRSYYPKLTAPQVKQIILDSGIYLTTPVIVGGDSKNVKPFNTLSKTGKIVNAYNALILADQVSRNLK